MAAQPILGVILAPVSWGEQGAQKQGSEDTGQSKSSRTLAPPLPVPYTHTVYSPVGSIQLFFLICIMIREQGQRGTEVPHRL